MKFYKVNLNFANKNLQITLANFKTYDKIRKVKEVKNKNIKLKTKNAKSKIDNTKFSIKLKVKNKKKANYKK